MTIGRLFSRIIGERWAAIAWTVVIFILLVLPGRSFPEQGILGQWHLDKVVHAGIFGTFVWLWHAWYARYHSVDGRKLLRAACWLFLIGSLYGAGMEFYQKYFTSREFETADILADSIGAALGAAWSMRGKK